MESQLIKKNILEKEEERGRERKRKKGQCERETSIRCRSYVIQLGTESTTWVCTLPGNQTRDPSVHGKMLQLTEPQWPRLINLNLNK